MSSRFNSILAVVNFLGLVLITAFLLNKKEKAVYVDSSKLINQYQGMIHAREQYKNKVGIWQSNLDTLVSEVRFELARYEKESAAMSPKERELAQKLISSKQQQLAAYQKATSEKASQEDAAATKKVIDEINAYLKQYGQEHNYTIIFAATEYGNIAYGKETLDVTEQVLAGLNQKSGSNVAK